MPRTGPAQAQTRPEGQSARVLARTVRNIQRRAVLVDHVRMEVSARKVLLLALAALAGTLALSALLQAAPHAVRLAVALAALAALALSYLWLGATMVRAYGSDEAAVERVRRRVRLHGAVVLAVPLVLFAARPWGLATVAIGGIAVVLTQASYTHVMLLAGLLRARRERRARHT
jgi:hypothetical protein